MDKVWERINLSRRLSLLVTVGQCRNRMLLLCLFLVWISTSCKDASEDSSLSLPSPTVSKSDTESDTSDSGQYWNGGDFSGQSVYSLSLGISQTAHDIFAACGLGDDHIETAVATHLEQPEIQYRGASRQGISEVTKDRTPIWWVSIGVTTISEDLYLVTCYGKRP